MTTLKRIAVETKNPTLPSKGYNHKKWTKHVYVYSQPVTVHQKRGPAVTGTGHFFKCLETGEVRMWGLDRGGKEQDDVDTN